MSSLGDLVVFPLRRKSFASQVLEVSKKLDKYYLGEELQGLLNERTSRYSSKAAVQYSRTNFGFRHKPDAHSTWLGSIIGSCFIKIDYRLSSKDFVSYGSFE